MVQLLLEIKDRVASAREAGQTALATEQLTPFETRDQTVLTAGYAANPLPVMEPNAPTARGKPKQSPARNLLNRWAKHRSAVLTFMYDFNVPFDNNLAERDLRMVKLKHKISGCFRTDSGAQTFCAIRSYISTARKNGHNILAALRLALVGTPFRPACLPPLTADG